MAPRRPPDILRKSHAHSEGKTRAADRRSLRHSIDDSLTDTLVSGGLLIDLDGVIYRGDEPIAGAAEALAAIDALGIPRLFVTNTTSRPRAAILAKLAGFGIAAGIDDILSPAVAARAWLEVRACRRLLTLVPEATLAEFAGFECLMPDGRKASNAADPEAPIDAVVVGDLGRDWSFDALNLAFRCLMRQPAPVLIALGMTRYWHAPDGLRLDTAPFVAALEHASGVVPVVVGKPAPAFYAAALERLGTTAATTLMVGDDIRADIAGAQAAGLAAILVRTGKFRPSDLGQGIAPDGLIDSIIDLPRVLAERASI